MCMNQGEPAAAYVIGEVVAVEAAVPRAPPPPPPLYVQSYEYYVDGRKLGLRHMGRLHLDPVQKKCSWQSYLTGNTTPWHGEYHRFPSGNLVCFSIMKAGRTAGSTQSYSLEAKAKTIEAGQSA